MPGVWWLGPLVVLATVDQAPAPSGAVEDLDAALAVLDELEQPPTAGEVAELADNDRAARAARARRRVTGALAMRWQAAGNGTAGYEGRIAGAGHGWDLRGRLRRSAGGARLEAATACLRGGPFTAVFGGWTWRQGFGLLGGGAGRAAALAVDGSLGPSLAGARGWTGWPDPRAGRGAALAATPRGWRLEAAGGSVDGGEAGRWLAAAGRSSGAWRVAVVRDRDGSVAGGACGRWRAGPWAGAWELAAAGHQAPASAAFAAHVAWQRPRTLRAEALVVAAPRGPAAGTAAAQPLLGSAAGVVWALRATARPASRAHLGVLVAGADREATAREGPRRRSLADVIGRAGIAAGMSLEVRMRVLTGSEAVWSPDWPWAPASREPTRRTESATLALTGRSAATRWQVRFRSYAVAHSATVGRRSLVAVTVRDGGGTAWRWRFTWRQAWGASVDLADAVSPVPGLLVARHWGGWSAGCFAAAGVRWRCFGLDAAIDLRERTGGTREWELWTAGEVRW